MNTPLTSSSAISDNPFLVILDDNPDDGNGLKVAFQRVLTELFPLGPQRCINLISLSDSLRSELGKNPDVALIDIDLPNEGVTGLELIDSWRERFPHIVFVAITGDSRKFMNISNVKGQPDILLPKTFLLGRRNLQNDFFRKQFLTRCIRQNRDIHIEMTVSLEKHLKRAVFGTDAGVFRSDIECLVRQVFLPEMSRFSSLDANLKPDTDFHMKRPPFDRVVLKEFLQEQGRSKSFVCIAAAYNGDEKLLVDTILKFCPPTNSTVELEKYEHYVKWMLPTQWRVDLLGRGRIQKLAVLGYSVAFDDASASRTLAESIRSGRYHEANSFIERFFSPTSKVWYGNIERTANDASLIDTLFARHYRRDIAALNSAISDLIEKLNPQIFDLGIPSVAKLLRTEFSTMIERQRLESFEGYWTCICHGDLHARNVLVSSTGEEFAFVDYMDIDRLHVFTDFVCLEVSIRIEDQSMNNPSADALAEWQLLENLVDGQSTLSDDSPKWLKSVANIRRLAFANFHSLTTQREYLLHLWVFIICRLISTSKESNDAFVRIEVLLVLLTAKLSSRNLSLRTTN